MSRPTLKELDGTNPGQNPYVLCRLFKKHDESLEGSNGEDVERTASTPMTANHSPDEIQSDSSLDPASSSQITEGEKPLTVIHENSEEAISNIITAVDSHSDGCDAPAAQNQIVKPAAEQDQPFNFEDFYDPTNQQLDDKLFSPVHAHFPPEIYYQSELQYGTNNNMSDFFDSVNWDAISYDTSSLELGSSFLNVRDNGSGSDSDVEMTNMTNLQALHGYPKEAVEQKSNVGLFQHTPQMAFSNDGSMGQVDDPIKNSGQLRDFDTFVNGDTGIRIRTRPGRNEQPNMNGMVQSQGIAPRRIRLLVDRQFASEKAPKDGSCASVPEDHNSKTTISREWNASENHATDDSSGSCNDVDEAEKESPESSDLRKITRQHIATAESLISKESRRGRHTSKVLSNRGMWSYVLAVSATVLVSVTVIVNIWAYVRS